MASQAQPQANPSPGYETSAPARHTATVIFRNFHLRELGKVAATEENVAKIVDVCTQMFRILPALDSVVKSAFWPSQNSVRENLDRLREAVKSLEEVGQPLQGTSEAPTNRYEVSGAAWKACAMLRRHFEFSSRSTFSPSDRNLAILVDVCSWAFRVGNVINRIASQSLWVGKDELPSRLDEIRKALRAVEIITNGVPKYEISGDLVFSRESPAEEPRLTREQKEERSRIAMAVSSARTAQEQQAVLVKAGILGRA